MEVESSANTKLFCYNPFCRYNITVSEKISFLSVPKWTQISYPDNTNSISNSLISYEKITRHSFFDYSSQKYVYFCSSCKEHIHIEYFIATSLFQKILGELI